MVTPTSEPEAPVGLIIDSSSQIPAEMVHRFNVDVVPISVMVDGIGYREGVDLTAEGFYELVSDPLPEITTSQPAPGEFLAAYTAAADRGCAEALCVTVGSDHSGTYNSARIAAEMAPIPVHLVDSGSLSFGITACLWEAAAALAAGATVKAAASNALALAPQITSTFVLASLEQVRKMGRVDLDALDTADAPEETTVFLTRDTAFETVGTATTIPDLSALMVNQVPSDIAVRVGVCLAAPETAPYTEAIEAALADRPNVVEVVRYRVGPSIAAHTGPGTAGLFFWPTQT